MHDTVTVLLDESMSPNRLGALLHATRKRRGWKRRHAAAMVRISAGDLRAYERGGRRIPADVCARLVECYGDELRDQLPVRVAPVIDTTSVAVGDERQPLPAATPDDVITTYVAIVQRLRNAKPGATVPVRTSDVVALAAALEASPEAIEQQIMHALGCSQGEARALHRELLQRRIIVPVAGLAAGVVMFAGVHTAQADDHSARVPHLDVPVASAPAGAAAPPTTDITSSTTVPREAVVTATSIPSITQTTPRPATHAIAPSAETAPPPPETSAPVATPPSISPDTTPEGVLPGEHPLPHP